MLLSSACTQRETVTIDGSSTVYPIVEAAAELFYKEHPEISVQVSFSGTGAGFQKLIRGEIDILDASRPAKPEELQRLKEAGLRIIEFVIAYDGLTVVVHPKNTWVDYLTLDELRRMWAPEAQNKIVRWNQIRPTFPDAPLRLYGPGHASGTFDFFTEVVVGEAGKSRGDYQASEDDNVLVQGVSGDLYGLGYFGYAYYVENRERLRAVPLVNTQGDTVLPDTQTIRNRTYPLSRPLFVYVREDALRRPAVRTFVEFLLKHIHEIVQDVGYIPVPREVEQANLRRFREALART